MQEITFITEEPQTTYIAEKDYSIVHKVAIGSKFLERLEICPIPERYQPRFMSKHTKATNQLTRHRNNPD